MKILKNIGWFFVLFIVLACIIAINVFYYKGVIESNFPLWVKIFLLS